MDVFIGTQCILITHTHQKIKQDVAVLPVKGCIAAVIYQITWPNIPYTLQWAKRYPQNCPFLWWDLTQYLIRGSLGPPYVPHIILIGSAILTELIVVANRQTVRHNIGNNWQQLMFHIEIWPETYKDDDRPITFPMKTQIFPSSARTRHSLR